MKKINKNRRVIWSNNDFDEWLKCMIADMSEDETEDDFDEVRYSEDCSIWLSDERSNLNIPIDGCIVCFAVLDLWNGRYNGAKIIGDNIKNILRGGCGDYVTWFCKPLPLTFHNSCAWALMPTTVIAIINNIFFMWILF